MRRIVIFGLVCLTIHNGALAQPDTGQPDWLDQARLVASKYGITVGEAVRRARLQIKVHRANEKFFNDPDYAGSVILQNAGGFRAKFAFKGGKRPALDDQELRDISDFSSAPRSLADLRQSREALWERLLQSGGRFAFTEDVETQTMKLYPDDPVKFQQAVREAGIKIPDYVEIQSAPLKPTPQYDVYGSGSIDYSGSTDNCTGGFIVTNGSVRGLSTAGHCAIPPLPSTHRGQPIGTLQSGISQLYDGNGLDVAWFRNSTFVYPNRVRINSTSYYTVTTALAAPTARYATTCVLPRAAPQVCTTVRDYAYWPKKGAPSTDRSDGPYVITEQYLTADKDSGAPWLYGGEAHGIHYGAVNDNGVLRSLYSPVSSLWKIGLSVATTP